MNGYGMNHRMQRILKRVLDIAVSVAALVLLSVLFALIALAIKIDSPGSVIFRHRRIGKDGHPFELYKFRTMRIGSDDSDYRVYLEKLIQSERDGTQFGLPYLKMLDDPRITRVGKWLRRSYIDEFPQLLNVLRGEMSLVGPRPHVQLEVDHYTVEQRRRLSVKPGVTGQWQVHGRSHCTFGQLIQSDLDYIDHWNLGVDITILFQTLLLIVGGDAGLPAHVLGRIRTGKTGREAASAPPEHTVELPGPTNTPPVLHEPPFRIHPEMPQVPKEAEL